MAQDEYNTDTLEQTGSVFNMAVAYLERINKIFYLINEAKLVPNYNLWYRGLIVLYGEIYPEMNKEQEEKSKELLDCVINVYEKSSRSHLYGQVSSDKKTRQMDGAFTALELYLKKVMKKNGMLTPSREDPRFAILS